VRRLADERPQALDLARGSFRLEHVGHARAEHAVPFTSLRRRSVPLLRLVPVLVAALLVCSPPSSLKQPSPMKMCWGS
jgi:hypothetical protein